MISNNGIFKVVHNDLHPQPGRLLISEPFLRDAYFQRSVVLLVEHSGDTGSMGFILNKKTKLTINMLFPELEHLPETPNLPGWSCCFEPFVLCSFIGQCGYSEFISY